MSHDFTTLRKDDDNNNNKIEKKSEKKKKIIIIKNEEDSQAQSGFNLQVVYVYVCAHVMFCFFESTE
ncbi:Uncharacterized protein APZ42_019549 [Daphnia magna]|uniref:Uncharacterized protein n=1 Tax=Daphnia magna TaxID=35525 RepID=A0A162CNI2_9CRUS|nr:Uncharacterized protein APZ42_019549 [Daphnia magna]